MNLYIFAELYEKTQNMTTLSKMFLAILSLFVFTSVALPKDPIKYGKVEMSELTMTKYPLDSTASAVVLCNFGYFNAQQFNYVQNIRIKILTEEGKKWADYMVPVSEKATIKGQTYNLENGKIVISKLKKESIFSKEIVKGLYNVRVSMPDVKVGSVIDIEYYYNDMPRSFSFQDEIPVAWSELRIEPHLNISYRKNFIGYHPLIISENDRWVAKDVPAFKSELYMKSAKNYMKSVSIDVERIQIPEQMIYKEYATSWNQIVGLMMADEDFGQRLTTFAYYLRNAVNTIEAQDTSKYARMVAAYNEIKKIKWNNDYSFWCTDEGMSDAFKKKSGNSAEINMLLINLLRKLDIKVEPVMVSTRSNGEILPHVVSYSHFNHVIAYASINGEQYLLDAIDENLPLNLLPVEDLNGRALLVHKKTFEWLDLQPKVKAKTKRVYNLEMTKEGLLKGLCSTVYGDYAALSARTQFKKYTSSDEYLKALENKTIGLTIDDYANRNLDSLHRTFNESYKVSLKNKVVKADDKLYIKLPSLGEIDSNPFKMNERTYPVDFGTPSEQVFILALKIPEGFTVEQLPRSEKAEMPNQGGSFQMQATNSEDVIQLMCKFNINKTSYGAEQYEDLKAFFDYVIKKQADMIVLKKI